MPRLRERGPVRASKSRPFMSERERTMPYAGLELTSKRPSRSRMAPRAARTFKTLTRWLAARAA